MQVVNQGHEVLGVAVASRRRKKPRRLIAPGTIEGVFHERKKLDVSETATSDVLNEWSRDFAIAKESIGIGGITAPATQVHFIHRHRRVEGDVSPTLAHPLVVAPFVTQIPHHRARARGRFSALCERVGLFQWRAIVGGDDIFIDVAEFALGNHSLPDT